MFGYSLDNTVIMIIVIAVVFGGISAAFFTMGTKGKKKHLEASVDGYSSGGGSSSGKFCTRTAVRQQETKSSVETAELKFNFFSFLFPLKGFNRKIMVFLGKLYKR